MVTSSRERVTQPNSSRHSRAPLKVSFYVRCRVSPARAQGRKIRHFLHTCARTHRENAPTKMFKATPEALSVITADHQEHIHVCLVGSVKLSLKCKRFQKVLLGSTHLNPTPLNHPEPGTPSVKKTLG